jgi:hypothetical protein
VLLSQLTTAHAVACVRWLCVASFFPDLGVAVTVETAKNHHRFCRGDVEHTVRESAQQRASDVPVNLGEREWIALDGFKALVECL